jgi:hypothetical protein
MMASTTTIANVTATLAPRAQSRMSSQIVTPSSAQRAAELRGKAENKGSCRFSVRVGNAKSSTAAAE